jgi:hypothetical protein
MSDSLVDHMLNWFRAHDGAAWALLFSFWASWLGDTVWVLRVSARLERLERQAEGPRRKG